MPFSCRWPALGRPRALRTARAPGLSGRLTPVGTTPFLNVRQIERYRLSNGLKVILLQDPVAPVVSYQTWFNVGARHEREGITGIAHLFEHLMFKETTNLPEGAFSRILEEAGARDLNAWTWYDETVYTQSVPKHYLELVMQLESDRMVNLVLNERQLASEREVVINERRFRSEDDPYGRINEALGALAFDVHPYKWPVIGWRKDIEAISLEDCLLFYRSFYAPNNATLILAGDFDRDAALELVDRYYGDLEPQTLRWPEITEEPVQRGQRRKELELPIEAEILEMGIKVPGLSHPDRPALQVLDVVLSQGKSSRLDRKLIDSEIASSVGTMLAPFVDPSLYEIQVNLRAGRQAVEAEKIVFDELERLAREGITPQELARARNKCKVASYQELRDNSSRSHFLGIHEIATGKFEHGLEFLEAIDRVTLEDVQRVAGTWLRKEYSSLVIGKPAVGAVLPLESAEEIEEEDPEEGEAALLEALAEDMPAEVLADELAQVGVLPAVSVPLHVPGNPWTVQEFSLPEGSSLFMVEEKALPLVSLYMMLPGGLALEPHALEGLSELMAELMLRGTELRSREAFEESLDDLGASLEFSAEPDHFMVHGTALAEHWPALLELLQEALTRPAFIEAELERLRGETLAALLEARNDDKLVADHWFNRLLFPEHPYGRSALGTTRSLNAITRADVAGLYAGAIRRGGVMVGISGDISPERALESISALLAVLPAGRLESPVMSVPDIPSGRRIFLIDKPERTQTQIMLGHPGLPAAHPDQPLLALGTMAFGGSAFTTRLMQEVREKRGWSYGAYAKMDSHRDGGSTYIWVFPATGDAAACLRLVTDLYEQVQAEGIRQEELDYARRAILNGAAFDEDTSERCVRGTLIRRWLNTNRARNLKVIAEATLEQVNEALKRWYRPADLVCTVVCTASQLEPLLQDLPGVTAIQCLPYDHE